MKSSAKQKQYIDHDGLFKELLKTFFVEFLELFLPEVLQYIDLSTLQFLDKELFPDVLRRERSQVDLMAKVSYRDKESFIVILVEHQAQPSKDFPARLFRYFARLTELFGLPVYPIALMSYAKPLKAAPKKYVVNFPDRQLLKFTYPVIQLNQFYWRDFVRNPNPVASALMSRMRIPEPERVRVKWACLRMLGSLGLDDAKTHFLSGFIDTYLKLTPAEGQTWREEFAKLEPLEAKQMYKMTTSWQEEGRVEGRVEGLKKGLEALLEVRFGSEGLALVSKLPSNLTHQQLEDLLDLARTATLAELEKAH